MLPDIVTHNNNAIRDEFDNIYDPERDYVKRSVYTPSGSVTAYNGVFTNITAENIILAKNDALTDVVKDTIQYVPHSVMAKRFSTDRLDTAYNKGMSDTYSRITHDADSIVVPGFKYYKLIENNNGEILTVQDVLTDIYAKYQALSSKISGVAGSGTTQSAVAALSLDSGADEPAAYSASPAMARSKARTAAAPLDNAYPFENPDPISHPANYVYATIPQLRRNGLPKLHISDLLSGNVYTYYNANSPLITVTNTNTIDVECQSSGSIYTLCLKQSVENKTEFKILLERNGSLRKYLTVDTPNPELTRIQLQCKTPYSEATGTQWEIFGYSLPTADTVLDIITQ